MIDKHDNLEQSILARLVGCQLIHSWRYLDTELFCFSFYKPQLGEPPLDMQSSPPVVYSLHVQCCIEKYTCSNEGPVKQCCLDGNSRTEDFLKALEPLRGKVLSSVRLEKDNMLSLFFENCCLRFCSYAMDTDEIWRMFPWPNGEYHLVATKSIIETEVC